jgi:glycosyltransferase involved in cell wall biosynthesis
LQLARPLVALPFAYRNRYLRHLLDQVDLLVSPSRFLRQQYEDQGFPAEKIVVLENGLDMGRLRETPDPPLPQPAARPHFGFLGSLAWQKGVHILIDAFNRLPEHTSLTIYGSETVFPEYVAQLRAAARHPHIRFAGQLDHRHVGAALQQMDCLIVPSLWYENSPVTIQEAFASGVPVIASRLGALTEKVQDGRTGRLFDAGRSEALARVLLGIVENPEQLTRLRANIRPGPTIEQHAQEIVSCYEALRLSGRPTSS